MGRWMVCAAALLAWAVLAPARAAEVVVRVDKDAQRMTVTVDGQERYAWAVSTGTSGYETPAGSFRPNRLVADHRSKEWDDAPMPHSIFFTEAGHAIHGSHAVRRLGSPASHGCVRLAPTHARALFALVRTEGMGNTRIEITGTEGIATGVAGGTSGTPLDYRRLTSFNPMVSGIMVGGTEAPRRPRTP